MCSNFHKAWCLVFNSLPCALFHTAGEQDRGKDEEGEQEEEEEEGEEGEKDKLPKSKWKPPPTVPNEKAKSGVNKKTYFVCNQRETYCTQLSTHCKSITHKEVYTCLYTYMNM